MKSIIASILFVSTTGAFAAEDTWTFKPEIYARGGATYKSDFSREAGRGRSSAFNNGPYLEESLIDSPLTEVTLHSSYGDQFIYHLGFDVDSNRRFVSKSDGPNKAPLTERINFLEFKSTPDVSIWYGNRPFRSPPEFLSRAFLFDEINILGGGVHIDNLGPLKADFAYGSFEDDSSDATTSVTTQEHTNVVIQKLELPLSNGTIKSNFELQQTKKTTSDGVGEAGTHGYLAGLAWQRWGDVVLGGGLYQQFIAHYSQGYIARSIMSTPFNEFDKDHAASKLLVGWNGDWKMDKFALYWLALYQANQGDAEGIARKDIVWSTLDGMVRPVYALTPQLNVGMEWDRRAAVKEGNALRSGYNGKTFEWATNNGSTRLGALVNYTLRNKNFNTPTIGIFAGEVKKDRLVQFYNSEAPKKSTRFVHFFYEVSIN